MDTCLVSLLAVVLIVLLAVPLTVQGQNAGPAVGTAGAQGQGVGQGLAPPPAAQPDVQRGGQRGQANAAPALPTPRWPDGKPRLSALPGERGLWNGGGGGTAEIPYQPWAQAMMDFRRANEMEPHTRCKPSGGPRQFLTPYG